MTDAHLDDDAVSALLDGEATPAEAAHAEGCDACGARVAAFRAAAARIGEVGPVDEVARERAIAAALDARAVPLRARRPALPTWLVSAAAVVVLALVLVPLLGDTGDGDQDVAGSSDVAREETALGGGAGDDAAGSGAADSTMSLRAAVPVAAGHLGEVDEATVGDRVRAAVLGPAAATGDDGDDGEIATSTTATPPAGAPCEATLREADAELGDLRLTGTAEVDGQRATIVVYDVAGSDPPRLRAFVVAGDGCDVLLTSTFAAQ